MVNASSYASLVPLVPTSPATAVFERNPLALVCHTITNMACVTQQQHQLNPPLSHSQGLCPQYTKTDVVKARQQAIPKRTREDAAYCIRVWEKWAKSRMEQGVEVQPLAKMDTSNL